MNSINMIGRIVKDPEIKAAGRGTTIANVVLAVDDFVQKEKRSYFFDCVSFGKTAELIRDYYKKGQQIAFIGKLVVETWNDKEGKRHSRIKIVIENLTFLDKKHDGTSKNQSKPEMVQNAFNSDNDPNDDFGF